MASLALLQAARKFRKNTAGYKPVAASCWQREMTAEGLRQPPTLALQRNSRVSFASFSGESARLRRADSSPQYHQR